MEVQLQPWSTALGALELGWTLGVTLSFAKMTRPLEPSCQSVIYLSPTPKVRPLFKITHVIKITWTNCMYGVPVYVDKRIPIIGNEVSIQTPFDSGEWGSRSFTRKKLKHQSRSNSDWVLISWITDETVLLLFLSVNKIAPSIWGRAKILGEIKYFLGFRA